MTSRGGRTGQIALKRTPVELHVKPASLQVLFQFNIDNCRAEQSNIITMLLPRLQPPLRAALTTISRSATGGTQTTCLNEAFAQLAIRSRPGNASGVRWASHKAQGAVNKAKDGPGKRLGAKKSGGKISRSFIV